MRFFAMNDVKKTHNESFMTKAPYKNLTIITTLIKTNAMASDISFL